MTTFPLKYDCLKQQIYEYEEYNIIPIRSEDRYEIMKWRNEQIFYLRQNQALTKEDQDNYFNTVLTNIFEQEFPDQILFSFFKNNKLIGYGGLVHIDWENQNAEISFLIKTDLNNLKYYTESFTVFLKLIQQLALNIKMHKIYTYGYKTNDYRFSPLINSFFEKEVELKNHKKINDTWLDVLIYSKFL
jgi:RimJ/RimL family protein N-acetyltransferase